MANKQDFSIDTIKLAHYLMQHIDGFEGPASAEKFAGGQSNPTYLLTAKSGNYVLRRKPLGNLLKSAHAVDREYRVISALANTQIPVARVYHLCEDNSVIGSIFYVMEFIDGRVFWDPKLPELSKAQRKNLYSEMNRIMAALHSIDLEATGLSDFGRPGNYFQRQLERWTQQYRAAETEVITEMELLIAWLPENLPEDDGKLTLVHGDFRLDNMMFSRDSERVLALVDWELSTLGHPYADLAYQCMQLRMRSDSMLSGLGDVNRATLGIPSEQAYVAEYCNRMGIAEIPNWNFYLAFSFFRLAAILQGVKKRSLEGNSSNKNAAQMGEEIRPLLKLAAQIIS